MADELTNVLLLWRLYETERQLPNRNFAKDHSFEEWVQWLKGQVDGRRVDCDARR